MASSGVDGERYSLEGFADKELLAIVFSCNGCPTVKAAEDGLVALQEAYAGRRVQLLAINSNNSYLSPSDTYEEMVKRAEAKGFNFPYVKDEDGNVAKRFGAARTPHAFVLDGERRLRYRGRIADSRDPAKVTRRDPRDCARGPAGRERGPATRDGASGLRDRVVIRVDSRLSGWLHGPLAHVALH